MLKSIRAILRQRCPICHEGKVFASLWRMNERCPHCGVQLEREPGYFLGAMYYSYGMAVILLVPLGIVAWVYELSAGWLGFIAVLQTTLLSPLIFRYSRVLWLHMDQRFDPR